MKNLLISASLIAVGVFYFHRVMDYRPQEPQPEEKQPGEIVIANAPDGALRSRWQTPTPSPGK